ncbi:MAG: hypothetical protein E6Q35_10165 [Chryseobacterium cucumeris]|nr:MAG: hypothetical protein E6Q35_10165 [Chryseobacterium cucumeris]
MEILLIIILFVLIIYAFSTSGKLKKELLQKNTQITNLNQENSLLKVEISKLHLDKVTLSKKIAELLQHNDALRKYQDIIDVKVECDYLLKKAERDSLRLKEKAGQEFSEAQS